MLRSNSPPATSTEHIEHIVTTFRSNEQLLRDLKRSDPEMGWAG